MYTVEITEVWVSPYDADGEWLEGDTRILEGPTVSLDEYMDDEDMSPVDWAVRVIKVNGADEPSVSPIPEELGEHAWLSSTYEHPYGAKTLETSVRVIGDFTDAERAEIFRRVLAR